MKLKMERAWQRDDVNHSEAMTDIADYIACFYNRSGRTLRSAIQLPSSMNNGRTMTV
ncbi:MAG TPA: hypothetical protein VGC19_11930 [Rhodanobacter sp.]